MLAVGNLQHPIKSLNGSGYIQDATIKKWLDIPYMTYQEKFATSINRSTNDHIQDAPIKKLWNIPHDLFRNITEDMFYRFITKGSNSYTHLTLENIWYGQKKNSFFLLYLRHRCIRSNGAALVHFIGILKRGITQL